MPDLITNDRGHKVHHAPTGEAGIAWSSNFADIARTLIRDRPPTATDDGAAGYVLGDVWRNAGRLWTCIGVEAGAADWREVPLLDAAGQLVGPIIVQADDAATLAMTTPVPGQLVYATDGGGLRVGDGATPGGQEVGQAVERFEGAYSGRSMSLAPGTFTSVAGTITLAPGRWEFAITVGDFYSDRGSGTSEIRVAMFADNDWYKHRFAGYGQGESETSLDDPSAEAKMGNLTEANPATIRALGDGNGTARMIVGTLWIQGSGVTIDPRISADEATTDYGAPRYLFERLR